MGNSIYASLLTETDADAALLDAWLDERAAERAASEAEFPPEVEQAVQDNRRLAAAAGPYDDGIAPGQIRILSKRFTADPDVVPHVLVLEEWSDGLWLIAPFSPYATPATPAEMATGIELAGLCVIQAWNARSVHDVLLRKSFLFGTLPAQVLDEARDLFRNALSGKELPEGFAARRGPCILCEADPRRAYLSECMARLAPLSTAVKATERLLAEREAQDLNAVARTALGPDQVWRPGVCRPVFARKEYEYTLAAGSKPATVDTYAVGDAELVLSFYPDADEVQMSFYDAEGEPDTSFDGYGVLAGGVEFAGSFRDATLCLHAGDVRDAFALVDRDGVAVACTRKS